ncbi:MAG: YcgJ family protein [Alphaproteobacteria bacterium]
MRSRVGTKSVRTLLATIAAAGALAAPAAQAAQDLGKGVFSPEPGVLCDRKGGVCADATGISMSWTEKFLGSEAVRKFSKMTEGGSFDGTEFTLSNGVHCDTKAKTCTKSKFGKGISPKATKALFP